MAVRSFTNLPTDDESRSIAETLIMQNMNLRKSLFDQISRCDKLEEEYAYLEYHLQTLASEARQFAMGEPMIPLSFARALADALAALKANEE